MRAILQDAVNVAMANPAEPARPAAMPTLAESAGTAAGAAGSSSSAASTPASGMDTAGPYNPFTDSFGSGSGRGGYAAGVSIADDMMPSYSGGGAAPRTRMLEFSIQVKMMFFLPPVELLQRYFGIYIWSKH